MVDLLTSTVHILYILTSILTANYFILESVLANSMNVHAVYSPIFYPLIGSY